jgi:hypothetical protein
MISSLAGPSGRVVYGRSPAAIVVSNPTGGMDICVLSGRGLCDELITRPDMSYRLWRFVVCDHETSWTRRPQPALGCSARDNNNNNLKFNNETVFLFYNVRFVWKLFENFNTSLCFRHRTLCGILR